MRKYVLLFAMTAVLCIGSASAQVSKVTGRIISAEDGNPIPGVTVIVKETGTGAVTNMEGLYTIEVPSGGQTLQFKFVGMKGQEIAIAGQTTIDLVMQVDFINMDEVVVTALGIKKEKKALGYSVTEVNNDEITGSRETNVINALSGRVAGVQINNSSGMAGSSSRITIRGTSSLLYDNQPLFVIDGIPYDNSEHNVDESDVDQAILSGSTANTGIDIDPNQIESVSILKGAAASALYGSRAANGVVVITTKSGQDAKKSGKPQLNLTSRYGWENIIKPPIQRKYGQGIGGEYYDGETQKTSLIWGPRLDTTDLPTYDQFDLFFETGRTWENSASVQGGNEKATYFVSYTNLDQKGTVPKNKLVRNNLMARFSAQLSKRLNVEAKMEYIKTDNDRLNEGNDRESVMWTVLNGPITYNFLPAVDEDGNQRLYRTATRNNHFWLAENTLYSDTRERFLPSVGIGYKIMPWLTFNGRVGVDYYNDAAIYHENIGTIGSYPTGRIDQTLRTNRIFNSDLMLNFNKKFGSFDVSGVFGHNILDIYYTFDRVNAADLLIPDFYDLSNATSFANSEGTTKDRTVSLYGRATVGWKDMIYLEATGRNDWSSTLPSENNSYFYPSVSLSYLFTETFDIPENIMSFGKIRVSFAQVGNHPPAYATRTSFIQANPGDGQRGNIDFPFQGYGSYIESNVMGNPDLKPELTSETEIGFDLRFLQSRFNIDLSLYSKKSTDQIFAAPIPSETGFLQKVVNAGEITNKGIELMVTAVPVQISDFRWEIMVNYTRNKNEVVALTEGVESIRLAGFTSPGIFIRENTPYGVIWGTRYQRNEQGQVMVDDDPESATYGFPLIESDLGQIGVVTPDWLGGLRNTFEWKGFSISALIDVRKGGDLMNFDENYTTYYGSSIQTENRDQPVIVEGVKASDGTLNDIELDAFTYYTQIATLADEFMVQKSDFIKLREVSAGFRLPSKWLTKSFIRDVSVTFTGRNLWMKTDESFTGSDPELSLYGSNNGQGFLNFQMPSTRSYNISLNLGF